jgi:hypothetical protein
MSEYQYYGWQALDSHLNEKELEEVSALSSHMNEVSPTRAVVTYQWGSFKYKPAQIVFCKGKRAHFNNENGPSW